MSGVTSGVGKGMQNIRLLPRTNPIPLLTHFMPFSSQTAQSLWSVLKIILVILNFNCVRVTVAIH
jgi:hypothetical protein